MLIPHGVKLPGRQEGTQGGDAGRGAGPRWAGTHAAMLGPAGDVHPLRLPPAYPPHPKTQRSSVRLRHNIVVLLILLRTPQDFLRLRDTLGDIPLVILDQHRHEMLAPILEMLGNLHVDGELVFVFRVWVVRELGGEFHHPQTPPGTTIIGRHVRKVVTRKEPSTLVI